MIFISRRVKAAFLLFIAGLISLTGPFFITSETLPSRYQHMAWLGPILGYLGILLLIFSVLRLLLKR
jgi:uncharacterized membrane protein